MSNTKRHITIEAAKWNAHPLTNFVLATSYLSCVLVAIDLLVRYAK